jgi:hypothetical protein
MHGGIYMDRKIVNAVMIFLIIQFGISIVSPFVSSYLGFLGSMLTAALGAALFYIIETLRVPEMVQAKI